MASKGKKLYHITGIRYPYEKSWDKSKTHVHIDLEFMDVAIVNAIRRTLINNIETIGIRTEPYDKTQVKIYQNDTPLHNQFLSHRIGMVPINVVDTDNFNYEDYKLIIDVKNDTSYPKNIYSSDIKVKQISTNKLLSETETKKLFPPDPITGDYVLITILKPKYFNNDVKVHNINSIMNNNDELKLFLESDMTKSIGIEDGRFNPTTCCAYENMIDPNRVQEGLEKYMITQRQYINENGLTELSDEELTSRFNTSQKYRYYHVDDNGEPNKFTFKIETIGVIPPLIILHRGLKRLKLKINELITNLSKNNEDIIKIIPSNNLNNCFEFIIQKEDDTLGNILQNEIQKLYCNYGDKDNIVNYVGYVKTHPLKREIKLSIQTKNKMDIEDIIKNVIIPPCESIIKTLNKLENELEKSPQLAAEVKKIN